MLAKKRRFSILVAAIILMAGAVAANPLQGAESLKEKKVAQLLNAEANQLVSGFIEEFPQTLKEVPDNPLNQQMDALSELLRDPEFRGLMVGIALDILKSADVETIIKAKAEGIVDEKYMAEMIQISWDFADKVTPLIMKALTPPAKPAGPVSS